MSVGATSRRIVIWAAVGLLVGAGAAAGVGWAVIYYQHSRGWYVGGVAVLIGVGSAFGAWLIAALLALAVEIANNVGVLVDLAAREQGGES